MTIYVKCPGCGGEFRTQLQIDRKEDYNKGPNEVLEICKFCHASVRVARDTTYWMDE